MVLCSIGAVASLIAYGVNMSTYNEEKDYVKYYLKWGMSNTRLYRAGQTAVSAKQTADACLLYMLWRQQQLIPDFVWRHGGNRN